MPFSLYNLGRGFLRAVSTLDDFRDVSTLGATLFGGGKKSSEGSGGKPPARELRVESLMIPRLGPLYAAKDAEALAKYLADHMDTALARMRDFWSRNTDLQERYERVLGQEAWSAVEDGFGSRKTESQSPPKKGQQPQARSKIRDTVEMYLFYLTSLGKEALEADTGTSKTGGDKIIENEIKQLERSSAALNAANIAKSASNKGLAGLGAMLKGFADGLNLPD